MSKEIIIDKSLIKNLKEGWASLKESIRILEESNQKLEKQVNKFQL